MRVSITLLCLLLLCGCGEKATELVALRPPAVALTHVTEPKLGGETCRAMFVYGMECRAALRQCNGAINANRQWADALAGPSTPTEEAE